MSLSIAENSGMSEPRVRRLYSKNNSPFFGLFILTEGSSLTDASELPRLIILNNEPQAPPRAEKGIRISLPPATVAAKYLERACTTGDFGDSATGAVSSSAAGDNLGKGTGRLEVALKNDSTEGRTWGSGAEDEGRDIRGRFNAPEFRAGSELDAIGNASCRAQVQGSSIEWNGTFVIGSNLPVATSTAAVSS